MDNMWLYQTLSAKAIDKTADSRMAISITDTIFVAENQHAFK